MDHLIYDHTNLGDHPEDVAHASLEAIHSVVRHTEGRPVALSDIITASWLAKHRNHQALGTESPYELFF